MLKRSTADQSAETEVEAVAEVTASVRSMGTLRREREDSSSGLNGVTGARVLLKSLMVMPWGLLLNSIAS